MKAREKVGPGLENGAREARQNLGRNLGSLPVGKTNFGPEPTSTFKLALKRARVWILGDN